MARRILTLASLVAVAALLVPTFAEAQYGTTTTSAPPTTTTTAAVGGITVPSTVPPITRPTPPTRPGATTTTLRLNPGDLDLDDLLSGNLGRVLQTLTGNEKSRAAQQVAQIIQDIIDSVGVDINDITIVGGATVEQGEDPDAPVTLSFSTDGYDAFAVVTFIIESDPVLLGATEADENGRVSGTFELPSDLEPGEHTVSAIGEGPDGEPVVSQQTVRVAERADDANEDVAAPPVADDGGSVAWIFIVIGILVALALGGALTAAGRTQKPAAEETPS